MEIVMWAFLVILAGFFIFMLCGVGKLIWDENPSFAEFVKGLGSPVPGHKMVEKEKRPHKYHTGMWEYWWACECGEDDYRTRIMGAYRQYLSHRREARSEMHRAAWKTKDKAARKGWL